jgi:ADP-ribosylglycohydrolase
VLYSLDRVSIVVAKKPELANVEQFNAEVKKCPLAFHRDRDATHGSCVMSNCLAHFSEGRRDSARARQYTEQLHALGRRDLN